MKAFTVQIQNGGRPSKPMSFDLAKRYVMNDGKLSDLRALKVGLCITASNVIIKRVDDLDFSGTADDVQADTVADSKTQVNYRQGSVTYDGERVFNCYLRNDNQNWNGHALPVFDIAQLDTLMQVLRADNHVDIGGDDRLYIAHFESQYDVLVVLPEKYTDVNGHTFTGWAVGGGSWTWEEQSEPLTRRVKFRATTMTELFYTVDVEIPDGVDEADYLENYQRELDGALYENQGSDGDWDNAGYTVIADDE